MNLFDYLQTITGFQTPQLTASITIFSCIYYVLLVIALWKIFDKAHEPGWKSIIPIYNYVVFFKIVGLSPWYILILLLGLIPNVIVNIIFFICVAILKLVFAIDAAHSFGKGMGYTLGIYFLPSIFYLILGFGSAQYEGPFGEKK